ncbi:unnamed protein product [Pleuronectes platessa]|uniref:Uncharacterized protein n=1 Tax=Pleuronectes platessa TaxID=8262 RepID=A0A9N7ZDY3_PLEPL|nr:unnamed protein product [Pleuronectes platessa]
MTRPVDRNQPATRPGLEGPVGNLQCEQSGRGLMIGPDTHTGHKWREATAAQTSSSNKLQITSSAPTSSRPDHSCRADLDPPDLDPPGLDPPDLDPPGLDPPDLDPPEKQKPNTTCLWKHGLSMTSQRHDRNKGPGEQQQQQQGEFILFYGNNLLLSIKKRPPWEITQSLSSHQGVKYTPLESSRGGWRWVVRGQEVESSKCECVRCGDGK